MKKFFAGIAAAAIITVPMTSFALESMSKGALKKATGQAGVSIALDDVVIVQKSQPTTIYWDMDGVSSLAGTAGQIKAAGIKIEYTEAAQKLIVIDGILDGNKYGVSKLESTFKIADNGRNYGIGTVGIAVSGTVTDSSNGDMANASTDVDGLDVGENIIVTPAVLYTAADEAADPTHVAGTVKTPAVTRPAVAADITAANGDYTVRNYQTGISPLSIDVGTCKSLSVGLQYNMGTSALPDTDARKLDVGGVVIGLPTIEITTYHSNDTKIVSLATGATSIAKTANSGGTVPNVSNEFIRIEKSGTSQMAILGGRLEIAPH